jgi:Glycosyl transferases group 1
MTDRPLKILILSAFDGGNANVIRDFLFSFRAHSRHAYYYVFDCRILDADTDFAQFDVILIFWSVYLLGPDLSEATRERIRRAPPLKVLFLQDEYRDVRPMNAVMSQLGVQVMFTCVAAQDHETFYPKALIPSLEATYTVLPGYVPTYLEAVSVDPHAPRSLDIGYRSREVPYYLGDLGREKRIIADRFDAIASEHGFRSDISVRERDRLYGRRWLDFLAASRCVLGSASGASVVDFTGEIRRNCERHLSLSPAATYEDVKQRFFADVDWRVVIDTVSPRTFEAAAFRCTLVQHEGGYAEILDPERHYIRVRRDYSNIQDVVDRMRDHAYCQRLAENAYRDLIASRLYSYQTFAAQFDRRLAAHVGHPAARRAVSALKFYTTNFIKHRQAIVPRRDRYTVLPSKKLALDIWRRCLSRVPRGRFGAVIDRLIDNPNDFFVKAYTSTRIGLGVGPLRALVTQYLKDPQLRRHASYDSMLNDLLKLDIIRRVRLGILRARQPFQLSVDFDAGAGLVMLTSTPVGAGDDVAGEGRSRSTVGDSVLRTGLEEVLQRGLVKLIVWDHSALSLEIVYAPLGRKWITVGIGRGGIHRFDVLVQLARHYPAETTPVLMPILLGEPLTPAAEAAS